MLARLGEGAGGCDLLITPFSAAPRLRERGLLQDLNRGQLPNARNVDPDYLSLGVDGAMAYSVPYVLSVTGVGYRASAIPDPERTWGLFGTPAFRGRVALLDDPRETIGAALLSLGYSLNTRDERQLARARDVVIGWLKNGASLAGADEGASLAGGTADLALGRSPAIQEVQAQSNDVEFVVPREGGAIAAADLVIPKGSRQAGLAHALINFLHGPRIAAQSVDYLAMHCPNAPAYDLLDLDLKSDPTVYISREVLVRCEVIADLGADNAKYDRIWSEIRAAR